MHNFSFLFCAICRTPQRRNHPTERAVAFQNITIITVFSQFINRIRRFPYFSAMAMTFLSCFAQNRTFLPVRFRPGRRLPPCVPGGQPGLNDLCIPPQLELPVVRFAPPSAGVPPCGCGRPRNGAAGRPGGSSCAHLLWVYCTRKNVRRQATERLRKFFTDGLTGI